MFNIFKRKKEVKEEPKEIIPATQVGKTKQQVINCITSGGDNCDTCSSIKKCMKLKRQMKKIGVIR